MIFYDFYADVPRETLDAFVQDREMAQIGKVNLVVMDCEYARNNEVVGASDQRDEPYA